jgi:hypothetical protein
MYVIIQAGLIDQINSNQMVIVHETAAASLYCRSVKINKIKCGSTYCYIKLPLNPGDIYIMINAEGMIQ